MTAVRWPGVTRSVTNWIFWYKKPTPGMRITENGKLVTLAIEDPLGVYREFYFLASDGDALPAT